MFANQDSLSRRAMLKVGSAGFGYLAFAGLSAWGQSPKSEIPSSSLAARNPHFPARAKRVIFLCMQGGPSHLDLFDYKPALIRDHGKASRFHGRLLQPVRSFSQRGESGLWISDALPRIGEHADELCLIRSMHCDRPTHTQAVTQMHTGTAQFVRPSLGAWTLYGLGTENQDVPGFIAMGSRASQAANLGSAFLPSAFAGTPIAARNSGRTATRIKRLGRQPTGGPGDGRDPVSTAQQRSRLDLVQQLNQAGKQAHPQHAGVEDAIESLEIAFRMQATMPELMDLSRETQATRALYGIDSSESEAFGTQCLLARRFSEAGVRFIQVTSNNWDHHRQLATQLPRKCQSIDQPIAGLLQDLKQRGLLEDTLVVWSGEFGRTPFAQNGDGRDHNNKGYTAWMAGGGVRGGMSYGATDEHGYEAVIDRCHVHDWHATILYLLGLDHENLTFRYAGRDYRLTDVHGKVLKGILA